jgi:hypothetical protein
LDVLTQIMRGQADRTIASSQLQAASLILDRGVGKAGQSLALQIDIKKRLSELSREELIALRAQYVAATTPALIEQLAQQAEDWKHATSAHDRSRGRAKAD